MTLLGREAPELPAELLFSDTELRILGDYTRSRRRERPGRLADAVREIAILGGHLNRNTDPPPGHPLIGHGDTRLVTPVGKE
ncbi:hypothetical protein [Halorhodospira abdelmalekii]|uniref:hypothetical protein n=1 Tax=Halorhodospira abdelmalekii TaxID=421629 RepID=UPI001F5BA86E|nr:hypothetical protein [Halorhodospira abdelmalekii]